MNVILSVEPIRFPLTGIGRYTYELAKGLQTSECLQSLKLFSGTRFIERLPVSADEPSGSHGMKRLIQKSETAMELYRRLMPLLRAQALNSHGNYIYHGPNFSLPPFPGPKVATIHDLSVFKWLETQDLVKVRYLQKELRKTLDSADALITPSEFVRKELAEYAGWPLEKIHAVPLAAGLEFRPRTENEVRQVLNRHGLNYQGYSLFVGTIEPRKNIIRLLEAYEQLPKSVRQRWPLILTGYRGWKSDNIHARIKDAERQGWAKYLGFLPAEELPLLYSGARLFVFPSLYEGFGLPVLEAMQSGVPVICSDRASLKEVAGYDLLMIDAEDIRNMAETLPKGLLDGPERKQMIANGLRQSSLFSWEKCSQLTHLAYKSLADRT